VQKQEIQIEVKPDVR